MVGARCLPAGTHRVGVGSVHHLCLFFRHLKKRRGKACQPVGVAFFYLAPIAAHDSFLALGATPRMVHQSVGSGGAGLRFRWRSRCALPSSSACRRRCSASLRCSSAFCCSAFFCCSASCCSFSFCCSASCCSWAWRRRSAASACSRRCASRSASSCSRWRSSASRSCSSACWSATYSRRCASRSSSSSR